MKRGNKAAKEYKMYFSDAQIAANLSILGLGNKPEFTLEDIKLAHKRAAAKYHPDRCKSGLEMMQAINPARDYLVEMLKTNPSIINKNAHADNQVVDYGQELNEALNAIIACEGLIIEVNSSWLWIGGNTKTHKDILKGAGFKYAAKKVKWFYKPASHKSKGRGTFTMDDIRATYGSQTVATQSRKKITA